MDTLLSLRVLHLVAELRSFVAAAERLGLSPAMVSKHVQHVETRIGARVLNRTSRRVSLTEAGAIYLARVRAVLEGLDETEAQIAQTAVVPRGRLRVSVPVWMANPAFTRVVAAYRIRYPEVTLDLDLSSRMVNLVEEGVDVALRATMNLEPGLVARKIREVYFQLVAAPAFLERVGRPMGLPDLNGAPFLAYTPVARDGRITWGQGSSVLTLQFAPVLLSDNETLLMLAAREGMGFAILPHWLVADDLAAGQLEHVLPDLVHATGPLYAVYPERSYLPAKVRSFLDFIVESTCL